MRWFGRKEERATTTLRDPAPWLLEFGSGSTSSGQRVTAEKSLGIAAVYGAVRLISETVGMLPLKVYKDSGDGSREEARAHRMWRVMHDQPNPVQAAHRFWSTAVCHYLLWGNIYIQKLRNELGLVDELWLLRPWTVTIQWDSGLRRKTFLEETLDGRRTYSDEDVLHIPGFSTDGLIGRSPITTAREALGTALARERFEGEFYQRGGVLPGVLKHPQKLSGEAQDRLKARFKTILQNNEWAVLEEGLDATPLSMPLADMQFVESKQLSIRDVANLFNLPVSFLNGSSGDSLTYATVESNQIQFTQVTISPIVNAIAKAITKDPALFPQSVFLAEFVIDGIHRGDMQTRVEYYTKMIGIGALTINEVRGYENLPPMPEPQMPFRPVLPPRLPPPDVQAVESTTTPAGDVATEGG